MKNFSNWILKIAAFSTLFSQLTIAGNFPNVNSTSDTDEMVEAYLPYLQFAMEIGREVDAPNTKRLAVVYSNLKKRSPSGAALFLKGLRFEMIQKADLLVQSPGRINNRTPEYRRFVAKYMREWVREADEHLFRSYAAQLARREE